MRILSVGDLVTILPPEGDPIKGRCRNGRIVGHCVLHYSYPDPTNLVYLVKLDDECGFYDPTGTCYVGTMVVSHDLVVDRA